MTLYFISLTIVDAYDRDSRRHSFTKLLLCGGGMYRPQYCQSLVVDTCVRLETM